MSRKKELVRCQCCGAWFNRRTYLGVLIEGITLCPACAESKGLWVPITRRVVREVKKEGEKNSSQKTDDIESNLTTPVVVGMVGH